MVRNGPVLDCKQRVSEAGLVVGCHISLGLVWRLGRLCRGHAVRTWGLSLWTWLTGEKNG